MVWASDNALAVAGAVTAVLASGRLYGLLRVTDSGPLDPSLVVQVGVAHPAYVLAALAGLAVFLFWRN